MRFISPNGGYRFVAVHDETIADTHGNMRTTKPGYTAEFKKGILTDYEKEIARQRLVFRGVPVNMDRTPIDPVSRASLFDSEWVEDKSIRVKVEKALLGGVGQDHILVEEEKIPAPWPSYDELEIHGRRNAEFVAGQNLETAKTTGVSLDVLIAYERQNRNDSRIIALYEAAKEAPAEPAEELVSA